MPEYRLSNRNEMRQKISEMSEDAIEQLYIGIMMLPQQERSDRIDDWILTETAITDRLDAAQETENVDTVRRIGIPEVNAMDSDERVRRYADILSTARETPASLTIRDANQFSVLYRTFQDDGLLDGPYELSEAAQQYGTSAPEDSGTDALNPDTADDTVSYGLIKGDRIAIEHVYADLDARTDDAWEIGNPVVATRQSYIRAESPVAELEATARNNGNVDISYTPEFTADDAIQLEDVYGIEAAVDAFLEDTVFEQDGSTLYTEGCDPAELENRFYALNQLDTMLREPDSAAEDTAPAFFLISSK